MPKYLIERDIPNAGELSDRDLQAIAIKSNKTHAELGPDIQWHESYVSDDKINCVFVAKNEELIREHAKRGEFPVTRITKINRVIDPTTAE